MEEIAFHKYSGAGNEFIITFDPLSLNSIPLLCDRHVGIGADGLILLESSTCADYRMRIFNCDGSEASMCGNGLRCVGAHIMKLGVKKEECTIETPKDPLLKIHRCANQGKKIFAEMGAPIEIALGKELFCEGERISYDFVNTGTPHALLSVNDVKSVSLPSMGAKIRFSPDFLPEGVNVNFATLKDQGIIALRTYEKGVENETPACGSGAVAAALCFALRYSLPSPIDVEVTSGEKLIVTFVFENNRFSQVGLIGSADYLHSGEFPLGIISLGNYSPWELSIFKLE